MSPVPLKKQSITGILTPKMRGLVPEVNVDPTTESDGVPSGLGKEVEVIMI